MAQRIRTSNSNRFKIMMWLKTRFARLSPALTGLALIVTSLASGEQFDGTEALFDSSAKGISKIDVSKYPPGLQENYKIFTQKCSQCHNLSRPINSDYVLPDEWSRCIGRMKRRSGSDIGSFEEEKLYDFLVYDSSIRKRDKLNAKLQSLTPDAQKEAESKIRKVAARYQ